MAARRRRDERPSVERKIHFYRADAGTDEDGTSLRFDPRPPLDHVDGLPFTPEGRYLVAADGSVLCCWVDRGTSPQHVRIGNIRRTELPEVEELGNLAPLNIPATSGLAEHIHAVFFEDGIVGVDFNFYGPRLTRFGSYLSQKAADQGGRVAFEPLLRLDVVEQLDRLRDIRMFQLKIRPAYGSVVRQADQSLGQAFEAAAEGTEASHVEIVLTPEPRSRRSLGERLLGVTRFLGRRDDLRDNAARFHVKGLDPEPQRVEEIDVLRDQLITSRRILRLNERTRVLDPASAYAAIEEAHRDLEHDLQQAAGAQLERDGSE